MDFIQPLAARSVTGKHCVQIWQSMRPAADLHLLHEHGPVCSQNAEPPAAALQHSVWLQQQRLEPLLPCAVGHVWRAEPGQAADADLVFSLVQLHGKLKALLCICQPKSTSRGSNLGRSRQLRQQLGHLASNRC